METAQAATCPPVSLHARIGDRLWDELLAGAPVLHAAAGAVLWRVRAPSRLVAVTSGVVRVIVWAPDHRQVPLRHARPGDLLGLVHLLAGTDMLSMEAVTDTTCALVAVDHLHGLATRYPDLGWAILEQVAAWGVAAVSTVLGTD
jgi:CRP-like cAMP-binding protein